MVVLGDGHFLMSGGTSLSEWRGSPAERMPSTSGFRVQGAGCRVQGSTSLSESGGSPADKMPSTRETPWRYRADSGRASNAACSPNPLHHRDDLEDRPGATGR